MIGQLNLDLLYFHQKMGDVGDPKKVTADKEKLGEEHPPDIGNGQNVSDLAYDHSQGWRCLRLFHWRKEKHERSHQSQTRQ